MIAVRFARPSHTQSTCTGQLSAAAAPTTYRPQRRVQ
jgi:hypothetical protein